MKLLKKGLCLGMAGLMALSLVACGGGKEQSATLVTEQNGVKMEYTIDAAGDSVHTITQVSSMDCSMYSDEEIALVEESAEEYSAIYDEYEGVEHSFSVEDGYLVETIKIDVSDKDTVSELVEAGLLPVDGSSTKISFKLTVESLQEQGWTLQE